MNEDILKKLPKKARYNMLIADIISTCLITLVLLVVGLILNAFESIPKTVITVYKVIFILAEIFLIGDLILTQLISYKRIKYLITDSSVEIHEGLFFVNHTIVPIRRMQQINIEQGPINKRFRLANIEITTAGGKTDLEYIEQDEAETIADLLKDRINEFAKEYATRERGAKDYGTKDYE